jgi:hypothetical protein
MENIKFKFEFFWNLNKIRNWTNFRNWTKHEFKQNSNLNNFQIWKKFKKAAKQTEPHKTRKTCTGKPWKTQRTKPKSENWKKLHKKARANGPRPISLLLRTEHNNTLPRAEYMICQKSMSISRLTDRPIGLLRSIIACITFLKDDSLRNAEGLLVAPLTDVYIWHLSSATTISVVFNQNSPVDWDEAHTETKISQRARRFDPIAWATFFLEPLFPFLKSTSYPSSPSWFDQFIA